MKKALGCQELSHSHLKAKLEAAVRICSSK